MFHFNVPWALLQKLLVYIFLWLYFISSEIRRISLPQPAISNYENWNIFYICMAGYRGGDLAAVPCTSSAALYTSRRCAPQALLLSALPWDECRQQEKKKELPVFCCSDLSRDFTLTLLKNLQTNLQSCTRSRMAKRFMPAPSSNLFLSLTLKNTGKWYFLEKWS